MVVDFGTLLTCQIWSEFQKITSWENFCIWVQALQCYLTILNFYITGIQTDVCFLCASFVFVLCLAFPMLSVSLDCQFLIAPWVFSNVNLFVIKFRIDTLLKIIKQVNTSKQNTHIMLKSDASGNVISFCRRHVSRVTLKICFLSNTICNDKDHSIWLGSTGPGLRQAHKCGGVKTLLMK